MINQEKLGHSKKMSFVSLFWNEAVSDLSNPLSAYSFMGEQKELLRKSRIRLSIDSLIL